MQIKYENPIFNEYTSSFSPNLDFKVWFNKEELLRPVYGKEIIEAHQEVRSIGKIEFRYFITTSKRSVTPNEARYLKIRNLNAGVGDRTNFGLGTEVGGARSRLHWLTGEIIIIEGLNDLITVSREGFNFDPNYEKLKEFFVKKLTSLSNQLEDVAEMEEFITQKREETKIRNLGLLNPKVVSRRIQRFKNDNVTSSSNVDLTTDLLNLEKKIKIKNRTFRVQLDRWDYKKDFYSALKIEQNVLYLNNNYPLFQGKKYTDLFIKMHLLLLLNLEEEEIKRSQYKKMADEILIIFHDYLK